MKVAYYTEEGLKALKAELDQLRDVERPRASQAIAEARDSQVGRACRQCSCDR